MSVVSDHSTKASFTVSIVHFYKFVSHSFWFVLLAWRDGIMYRGSSGNVRDTANDGDICDFVDLVPIGYHWFLSRYYQFPISSYWFSSRPYLIATHPY